MLDFCPYCDEDTLHVLVHDGNAIECTKCHTIWEAKPDEVQLEFDFSRQVD